MIELQEITDKALLEKLLKFDKEALFYDVLEDGRPTGRVSMRQEYGRYGDGAYSGMYSTPVSPIDEALTMVCTSKFLRELSSARWDRLAGDLDQQFWMKRVEQKVDKLTDKMDQLAKSSDNSI